MAKKTPGLRKRTEERPCALCYAPLSESEVYIHDKHRSTELGRKFLAGLEESRPKPKPQVDRPKPPPKAQKVESLLTETQQQVVDLLAGGFTVAQIAKLLGLSSQAIHGRLNAARSRVNAQTSCQLVAMVVRHKMLTREGGNRDGRYWREGKEGDYEDRAAGASESSEAARASA